MKKILPSAITAVVLAALTIPGSATAQQSPATAQSPVQAQQSRTTAQKSPATTRPPASAQQSPVRRTDLQRHDLSIPGREAFQVRVDIDPGITAPRHSHPGEEIIYVLEGLMEYQIDGQQPVTLKAGDVYFIPSGAIHSAKNVGTANAAELATYVVEKGKPLVVLAK
jgi:quercetin dioxygenase-like cupin family protein